MPRWITGLVCFLCLAGISPAQEPQSNSSVFKEVREAAFGFLTASSFQSMESYLADDIKAKFRDVEPEVLDLWFAKLAQLALARGTNVSGVERLPDPHPGLRLRLASSSWEDFQVEDETVTGTSAQLDLSAKCFRDGVEVGDSPFPSRLVFSMMQEHGAWRVQRVVVTTPVKLFDDSAIYNLGRSVMARNEASAITSIRWITSAELDFAEQNPSVGFTCEIRGLTAGRLEHVPQEELSGLRTIALKDGIRSGYRFAFGGCSAAGKTYQVSAEPIRPRRSGDHSYCSDQSGVIYVSSSGSGEACLKEKTPIR